MSAAGTIAYAATEPQRQRAAADRQRATAKVAAVVMSLTEALQDVDEPDAAQVVARLCDVRPVADRLVRALQAAEAPRPASTLDMAMMRHRVELGR